MPAVKIRLINRMPGGTDDLIDRAPTVTDSRSERAASETVDRRSTARDSRLLADRTHRRCQEASNRVDGASNRQTARC